MNKNIKETMKENIYIVYRKIKAFMNRFVFVLFRVLPVNNKLISVCTFEGKGGFGCNPKYIVEELHKRDKNYEFVWFVNDMELQFPEYIKKVKNSFFNRIFWLSKSKIWIDNYRKPYGTLKRKNQYYINTWHGTISIKAIGKYRGGKFPKIAQLVSADDSKNIDYLLSGSKWCDDHYKEGLVYDGEIIRLGTPRCDVLFDSSQTRKGDFRKRFNLPKEAKMIMYAPTFRGGSQKGVRSIFEQKNQIEFAQVIYELEKKFQGEWYVFVRLHPQLAAEKTRYVSSVHTNRIIDVTQESDMNELLSSMDAYISDYSSTIFEACLMGIPCFVYASDIQSYIDERGEFFWNMKELPFPLSENLDEFLDNIRTFDYDRYHLELKKLIEEQEIIEDGYSSKRVANLIESLINKT